MKVEYVFVRKDRDSCEHLYDEKFFYSVVCYNLKIQKLNNYLSKDRKDILK